MAAVDTCIQEEKGNWKVPPTVRAGISSQSSLRCPYNLRGQSQGLILNPARLTRQAVTLAEVCGTLTMLAAGELYTVFSALPG